MTDGLNLGESVGGDAVRGQIARYFRIFHLGHHFVSFGLCGFLSMSLIEPDKSGEGSTQSRSIAEPEPSTTAATSPEKAICKSMKQEEEIIKTLQQQVMRFRSGRALTRPVLKALRAAFYRLNTERVQQSVRV